MRRRFLLLIVLIAGGIVLFLDSSSLPKKNAAGVMGSALSLLPLLALFWQSAKRAAAETATAVQSGRAQSFKDVLAAELQETEKVEKIRKASFDPATGPPKPLFPYRLKDKRDRVRQIPNAGEVSPEKAIWTANQRKLLGLAFSGGGIRSATFNLGVLQGLAERKFLRRFHYLSTISGGGYIGSWLAAWIHRRGMKEVEERLGAQRVNQPKFKEPPEIRFLREYSNYLTPRTGLVGADTWTAVAIYLRNLVLNQSILVLFIAAIALAPRVVVAAAQYSRSWGSVPHPPFFLLLAALAACVLLMIARNMAYYNGSERVLARVKPASEWVKPVREDVVKVEWLAGKLEGYAGRLRARLGRIEIWDQNIMHRRDVAQATHISRLEAVQGTSATLVLDKPVSGVREGDLVFKVYPWIARQSGITLFVLLPAFLASAFLAWMLALGQPTSYSSIRPWLTDGAVAGALAWLWGMVIVACTAAGRRSWTWTQAPRMAGAIVASAVAGAAGGLLLMQAGFLLQKWLKQPAGMWNAIGFGTPLVTLVLLAFSVLQMGLLNRLFPDPRREWLGRLEAWLLIFCLIWASAFALAGYSPLLLLWLSQFPLSKWTAALAWVASTLIGVVGGRSAKTSGLDATVKDKLLGATPYIFVAGLLVLVSAGVHSILQHLDRGNRGPEQVVTRMTGTSPEQVTVRMTETSSQQVAVEVQALVKKEKKPLLPVAAYWNSLLTSLDGRVFYAFLLCLLAAVLLAWRVDLTEFSMHYFYRNRLVRCYLGASNRERVPNPFTGFDEDDDLFLAQLTSDNGYDGPYPILGCALNLVHGQDLAWQERKAASFIMTPRHCGYDVWYEKLLRPGQWETPGRDPGGYRPTGEYAYADGGFFLGTAMAISGAAASPNMGFHTSPALSFLMTVFNVRLGRWIGNPRHPKCWKKAGPAIGLGYLLTELLGSADDARNYVYLSDGGHFENLGLYELVKRRCRFILASDAGEDKNLAFNDLASAIRKCRSDMGIEIKIKTDKFFSAPASQFSQWHCAIGEILYRNSDPRWSQEPDSKKQIENGILVYIKTSLTNDEPADVLNYKTSHPDFPHQSTADQWFSESQFESYRALGQHIIQTLFHDLKGKCAGDLDQVDAEALFKQLGEQWTNSEAIHIHPTTSDAV